MDLQGKVKKLEDENERYRKSFSDIIERIRKRESENDKGRKSVDRIHEGKSIAYREVLNIISDCVKDRFCKKESLEERQYDEEVYMEIDKSGE